MDKISGLWQKKLSEFGKTRQPQTIQPDKYTFQDTKD